MKTRTATLAAVLAVLLLAVAAVASGCGSASLGRRRRCARRRDGDDARGRSRSAGENARKDPQEAALAWAKCMRENGIDVPDPEVDDGGGLTIRPGRRRPGARRHRLREVPEGAGGMRRALRRLRAGRRSRTSSARSCRRRCSSSLRCMREHGVDMPDPEFSGEGGGGLFRVGGPRRPRPRQRDVPEGAGGLSARSSRTRSPDVGRGRPNARERR